MVVEAIREGITDGTVKDDFDPVKSTILMASSIQSILNLLTFPQLANLGY